MADSPRLARRLTTADAVVIGLGSMIGAGLFSAFAPAAAAAGTGLLIGLLLAAVVAYCNASSPAQLAAQYPTSGGTYVYGRERLSPWWGFLAGWGVTRTAGLARILVAIVLVVLAIMLIAAWVTGQPDLARLDLTHAVGGAYGVLQAAGFLFFAFAGYARIATMGEEVREPERTIPRAIALALAVYAAVAVTLLAALGADPIATSAAPLATLATSTGLSWTTPVIAVGGAAASLGALLALIAGIGRTMLAMAREADLPRWLAAVHPVYRVPHRAEIAMAALVTLLVLTATTPCPRDQRRAGSGPVAVGGRRTDRQAGRWRPLGGRQLSRGRHGRAGRQGRHHHDCAAPLRKVKPWRSCR